MVAVTAGLIDPNSVELVVVVAAPLSTVGVAAVDVAAPPNETPAKRPPAEDVAGLMLPNSPVPGAIVAVVDVPKVEELGESTFWSRLVNAGKADFVGSASAAETTGSGSASFFGLSAACLIGSFSFSLVRFRAGVMVVGGTPKETGSLLVAPKEKVGLAALLLLLDPNAMTAGLTGSELSWAALGMACMVRPLPNPYAGGGAAESLFSLGFCGAGTVAWIGLMVVVPKSVVSFETSGFEG